MEGKTYDAQVEVLLSSLASMPGLQNLVDDLTTEELDLLNRVDFFAEPTEDDLKDFGPDFVDDLLETTLQRYRATQGLPVLAPSRWSRPSGPILSEGLELLRLLSEIDDRAALKGAPSSALTAKTIKLAGGLADLFTEEIDRALAAAR